MVKDDARRIRENNPRLPLHKQDSTREEKIRLKFNGETIKVIHFEYSFARWLKFDTLESRSEIPLMF
jgi:hypothetical protein